MFVLEFQGEERRKSKEDSGIIVMKLPQFFQSCKCFASVTSGKNVNSPTFRARFLEYATLAVALQMLNSVSALRGCLALNEVWWDSASERSQLPRAVSSCCG